VLRKRCASPSATRNITTAATKPSPRSKNSSRTERGDVRRDAHLPVRMRRRWRVRLCGWPEVDVSPLGQMASVGSPASFSARLRRSRPAGSSSSSISDRTEPESLASVSAGALHCLDDPGAVQLSGSIQRSSRNLAKSVSLEQTGMPCSIARAASWASVTRLPRIS
jgi:hypothetical protein